MRFVPAQLLFGSDAPTANLRRLQKLGQYPKSEEQIHADPHSPLLGTYTPPAPYRVFRLVKK